MAAGLALCCAVLTLRGEAQAAVGPPQLDTASMCEATLATHAPDPLLDECAASEARALSYLQAAYPAVPARVRTRCERLSRKGSKGFGSYAFIVACLDLK